MVRLGTRAKSSGGSAGIRGLDWGAAPLFPTHVPNAEIIQGVLIGGFLILSLGIHEAAHAWSASKLGDRTAEMEGRMTLNPIVHIDLFMTILLPAVMWFTMGIMFGGAKPVPVVKQNLRKPNRDMALVAAAGPASNLILAILFIVLLKASVAYGDFDFGAGKRDLLPSVLYWSAMTNVLLAIFNLLPIPPLDGSRVLAALMPRDLRDGYESLGQFGILLVFGAFYLVPGVREMLWGGMDLTWSALNTLTGGKW